MKKVVIYFLVVVGLCSSLFSYELKADRLERFTKLEENENMYVIFHQYTYPEDRIIEKKAYEEGKFILRVGTTTFDEYYSRSRKERYYNEKEFQNPDMTVQEYIEKRKKNIDLFDAPPSEYLIESFLEEKNHTLFIKFFIDNYDGAEPISHYILWDIHPDGIMDFYYFTDPGKGKERTELKEALKEYFVYYNKPEECLVGYYWKSEEEMDRFYEDMKAKKESLPELVIKFQETWEYILESLE